MQAISAVDLALWDLLGHIHQQPVYALLGGKTKDRLPVYCTSARPDISKELGFCGAKVPCPYGPSAGDEGFRKNVEIFKEYREKVGPDFPLALDCYMALSVPYAIRLAKALQPYGIKWIEEVLPPVSPLPLPPPPPPPTHPTH
jgi:L-rhamnonate dehydratase